MWYALAVTKRYYASWLDVSPECLELPGIVTVPSPKREIRQQGYGRCFDVYAYIAGETTIISYHRQLGEHIEAVREAFGHSRDPGSVCRWLSEGFGWRPSHELKYVFTGLPSGLEAGFARRLTVADYADFLRFHQEQYPTGEQEAWLEAYFVDLVARGYVYGVYADGRLVSATDMPDVPYMADEVAEPGINTLAGYRQRGYARNVVVALLKHLIEMRVVPLWSCAASNVASQHLAECVGYRRLADVITLTL